MAQVMTLRADGRQSGHWERYWDETDEVSAMLGGVRQREALAAHWRGYFLSARSSVRGPLLELACGAAPVLAHMDFTAGPPALAVCTDISRAALAAAGASARQLRPVVCGASALPFRAGGFSLVVSQFGVEYAGRDGFAAAAETVAAGGGLACVIHMHGGAIYRECAENARVLLIGESSNLLGRLRSTLSASYASINDRSARRRAAAAEESFASAWRAVSARIEEASPSIARDLVKRYLGDMARVAERRRAYAPEEALAWVDGVAARLADYRGRMSAMTAAALDDGDVADIRALFADAGLTEFEAEPLRLNEAETPAAWWITAHRRVS